MKILFSLLIICVLGIPAAQGQKLKKAPFKESLSLKLEVMRVYEDSLKHLQMNADSLFPDAFHRKVKAMITRRNAALSNIKSSPKYIKVDSVQANVKKHVTHP